MSKPLSTYAPIVIDRLPKVRMRPLHGRFLIISSLILILATTALPAAERISEGATTIHLKNGKTLQPESWWIDGDILHYQQYGGTISISLAKVDIEKTNKAAIQEEKEKAEKRVDPEGQEPPHSPCSVPPPDVEGWNKARWEMSEQELLNSFKGQLQPCTKESPLDESYVKFCITDLLIGTHKYDVLFVMGNKTKKLQSINIEFAEDEWPQAGALFTELREVLTRKYGPSTDTSKQTVRTITTYDSRWRFPTTIIELNVCEFGPSAQLLSKMREVSRTNKKSAESLHKAIMRPYFNLSYSPTKTTDEMVIREKEEAAEAQRKAHYDLELLKWHWSPEHGYVTAEGEVKNISQTKLKSVQAVVTWYDENRQMITSDSALIQYDPIMPGQTSPFKVMARYNPEMNSATVIFKHFWGDVIRTYRSKE